MATSNKSSGSVSGRIILQADPHEHHRQLKATVRGPKGDQAVKVDEQGAIAIDPKLIVDGAVLELSGADPDETLSLGLDSVVAALRAGDDLRIAETAWVPLFPPFACVSGRVTVCRPIWVDPRVSVIPQVASQLRSRSFVQVLGDVQDPETSELRFVAAKSPSALIAGRYPIHGICEAVCQGKVEVFVRTCCCRPPIPPIWQLIEHLCEVIDCNPPVVPPHPWPDPGPEFGRLLAQRIAPALAQSFESGADELDVELRLAAAGHLVEIASRPDLASQIEYVKATPSLVDFLCQCSVRLVATTNLLDDGKFNACFRLSPAAPNCIQRVQYRVSQFTPSGWRVVYDGLVSHQSFGLNEQANLSASWVARGCPSGPVIDPNQIPFVLIESIGSASPARILRTSGQVDRASYGALAPSDGLIYPRPSGVTDPAAGPFEMAWCQDLSLRFRFDERLRLAPFNATKYRLRYAPISDSGAVDPNEEQPVIDQPVWQRYNTGPLGPYLEPVSLFTATPGVYRIPYDDQPFTRPWFGGQYHVTFHSGPIQNGRFALILELMREDESLVHPNTLDPESGPVAGVGLPFEYLRLIDPIMSGATMNTTPVRHSALSTVLHINNRPVSADITDIVFNGVSSNVNCQFLSGRACDTVAMRYTANHPDGFQWYHQIWYKQGLTGPVIPSAPSPAEVRSTNVVGGVSTARTLSEMLGSEVRCSFAGNLYVHARHTNGFGQYQPFDRSDQAAFALESTGSCP